MMFASPPRKKGMPWWGILLIVMGVFVVLGIGSLVWLVRWFDQNKDRIVTDTKQTQEQATAFASSHAQSACMEEGLTRARKCDGVWCNAQQQLFVNVCLQTATPTPGLCTGVPKPIAAGRWNADQCEKRGQSGQACTLVMNAIPTYCESLDGGK